MEVRTEQMYDLQRRQGSLPEIHIPQRQLDKQLAGMEYVALLSRLAMNAVSDAHLFAVLKVLMTIEQAERLKQTCENLPPEAEASLREITGRYLATMEAIPQEVSAKLLSELGKIPPNLGDESLLSKVRSWLENQL